MDKKIQIKSQGAASLEYTELVPFQGNLKSLHQDDYERFKARILELGFSEPISVWRNKGKNYILNGHQRLRTIQKMVEKEGYKCPPLPISIVQADNFKQAKRKVLSMASQYGRIEKDGLYEFMHESDIKIEDMISDFRMPEIDTGKFADEFFNNLEEDPLDVGGLGGEGELEGGKVHSAGVKMVQLFFDAADHDEFERLVILLKEKYKTDNVTDTVLMAIRDARNQT